MKDLAAFVHVFDGLEPWQGDTPQGFYPDWLGAQTEATFRAYMGMKPEDVGGGHIATRMPGIEDGEGWFEAVNQIEAARAARGRYVMITLGACYGAQAVGSWLALQKLNPMPATLVAVEPEPVNLQWVAKHFRNNGLDPDDHWLIGSAISASNDPVFFPVGAPGSGAQNCIVTNEPPARQAYVNRLTRSGDRAKRALRGLLLDNTTGLKRNLLSGEEIDTERDLRGAALLKARRLARRLRATWRDKPVEHGQPAAVPDMFDAEIRLLSAVTLKDVLGPFKHVDYLESDIQQSEIIVFPPFMDLVKRKVRRVHIGTHGKDVHTEMAGLFRRDGWRIVFDFEPNSRHETSLGPLALNDGVLTAVNTELA